MKIERVEWTETERWIAINALRSAAELYAGAANDASEPEQQRLRVQFTRQQSEALELAERIEQAERIDWHEETGGLDATTLGERSAGA